MGGEGRDSAYVKKLPTSEVPRWVLVGMEAEIAELRERLSEHGHSYYSPPKIRLGEGTDGR